MWHYPNMMNDGAAMKAFRAGVKRIEKQIADISNGFSDPRDMSPAVVKAFAALNRLEDRAYRDSIIGACETELARLRPAITAAEEAGRKWGRERRELLVTAPVATRSAGAVGAYQAELRIDMARRGVRL